jgi:CheY-specific phosphatase CheX
MQQPPAIALFQAATSTFESLALLFPEPCSTDGSEFLPLAAVVSVTYRGDGVGRVVVGVTAAMLPAISENMLGAAADASQELDALGEIANVVTGNALPLVHGAAAVFRLDAPAREGDNPFAPRNGESLTCITRLRMDEGEALIALLETAPAADVSHAAAAMAGV